MKYVCLCYHDEALQSASPHDSDALRRAIGAFVDELTERGDLYLAIRRRQIHGTMTIRSRSSGVYVTDGLATLDDEHFDTVLVIDARDLNDAVRIASESPLARWGTIEVIPVEDLCEMTVEDRCRCRRPSADY